MYEMTVSELESLIKTTEQEIAASILRFADLTKKPILDITLTYSPTHFTVSALVGQANFSTPKIITGVN